MIATGYVLLIVGILAMIGLSITMPLTIYNFILPIIGIVLLIVGYVKKYKGK